MSKNKHAHRGGTTGGAAAQKPAKQSQQPATKPAQTSSVPQKKSTTLVIAGLAAVLIIGAIVFVSGQGDRAPGSGGVIQPSAEEARYIGRLLPAGYRAPAVSEAVAYDSAVEMAELNLTSTDTQVSVPVAEVTGAKLALLQYEGAQSLPLIAYVKPSGALFVGVSYCPPCQGEWQTIQPDGTLTCNSCGTKRDLESQAGISGTCKLYPLDELPVTIVDGNIVIERSIIDTWTAQPLDRKVG